jgi:hypothetical protein
VSRLIRCVDDASEVDGRVLIDKHVLAAQDLGKWFYKRSKRGYKKKTKLIDTLKMEGSKILRK